MLPRPRRLARGDFARLYKRGRRLRLPSVTVWWLPGLKGETFSRYGVVVSTRVAKRAVERNRYRRRLAACLSQQAHQAPPYHVIISANPSIGQRTFADLRLEIGRLMANFPPRNSR